MTPKLLTPIIPKEKVLAGTLKKVFTNWWSIPVGCFSPSDHNLIQFLVVFTVVIILFGGDLYLALHGETINERNSNSSSFNPVDDTNLGIHHDETRSEWIPQLQYVVYTDTYGKG